MPSTEQIAKALRAAADSLDPQAEQEPAEPQEPQHPTEPQEPYEPEVPEEPPVPPASSGEFYVDGGTAELEAAALENEGMKAEAGYIRLAIASKPQAVWFNGGDTGYVAACSLEARNLGQDLSSVLYNVPDRDAGNFSKGGEANLADYKASVDRYVQALGDTPTWVCIEPDSTVLPDQLSQLRIDCLNYAMRTLSGKANIRPYIDAGHSNWRSPAEMAQRINSLAVPPRVGISLNVSSWQSTKAIYEFWTQLRPLLKGGSKSCVIDTSRNGTQTDRVYQWANVWHQKAGTVSTTQTGLETVDAFLWIKRPGESDGEDVPAGHWHRWWALDFAKHTLGIPTE